jgi:hypothetical protein
VKGRTQQAVQATAARAVRDAVVATLVFALLGLAQEHPGESFDGRLQDGPITLM